jgi:hypothetical protein
MGWSQSLRCGLTTAQNAKRSPETGDLSLHVPVERTRYFVAMVGFTQPFFMMPCDGRKLR